MSAADVIAEAIRDHLEDLDVMCPLWHRDYEAGDVPCYAHQRVIDSLVQPLTEAVGAALSAAGYVVATPEEIRAWPVEQQAALIGGEVVDVGEGFSWVLGPAVENDEVQRCT